MNGFPVSLADDVEALAAELARDCRLDARLIGQAASSGRYDPQDLKRVWHYVARFGRPARRWRESHG